MLFAMSVPHMAIHSAEDAPDEAAPFMCIACNAPVFLRRATHQRHHWAHLRNAVCPMRRDAGTMTEYRARVAREIHTYAPTGAH